MSKKDMTISKTAALAIFAALGITAAPRWNATRLKAKINKLGDMIDEDTEIEDKKVRADADAVITCLDGGGAVTVGDEATEEEKPKGKGKPAPKDKPAAEEKPKGKPAAPAAKKDAPAKKVKSETPGVRETRTRPFLAGAIIKEQGGLAAGVTEEMVAELDERYGKENPAESLFCLRNAWHAIRGFQKGDKDAK